MTYRKPWTGGAKAYPEADTFADLAEGMKRKRKVQMVHMPNDGEAGLEKCATCGVRLRMKYAANKGGPKTQQDKFSTWTYYPAKKVAVGQHYGCSWLTLMQDVYALGKKMGY